MSHSPLRPHLHPQEIARRQRWVVVGVTILTILLVATWLVTLQNRISQAPGEQFGWRMFLGTVPKSSFIDTDAIINNNTRKQQDNELLQAVAGLLQPTTSTAEIVVASTSTKK